MGGQQSTVDTKNMAKADIHGVVTDPDESDWPAWYKPAQGDTYQMINGQLYVVNGDQALPVSEDIKRRAVGKQIEAIAPALVGGGASGAAFGAGMGVHGAVSGGLAGAVGGLISGLFGGATNVDMTTNAQIEAQKKAEEAAQHQALVDLGKEVTHQIIAGAQEATQPSTETQQPSTS